MRRELEKIGYLIGANIARASNPHTTNLSRHLAPNVGHELLRRSIEFSSATAFCYTAYAYNMHVATVIVLCVKYS